MWRLLLFILPLGLDTLGVAISIGIKSDVGVPEQREFRWRTARGSFPPWLLSALLFSCAEMLMPLLGIILGYAVSLVLSNVMHIVGPLLLIGVGGWELIEEIREWLEKRGFGVGAEQEKKKRQQAPREKKQAMWLHQLLLAISISLDELVVGFSLGGLTRSLGGSLSPLAFCAMVGIQSFLVTILGITAGRLLRVRLKPIREWSELLSAVLLIGLGVWLFFLG